MICPECQGTGFVERVNYFGYFEEPCRHCYDSLGEVNDDDEGADD